MAISETGPGEAL